MSESSNTWCANHFYDLSEKTALFEQLPRRASCRCFRSSPSATQWEALGEAARQLVLPKARLELGLCSSDLFRPFLGLLMKFEGVHRFVAVIGDGSPEGEVNAGLCGEMLLLKAVQLGMAGVWVSGTYKRKAVPITLASGEKLHSLIALGVPPEGFSVGERKRKPLEKLIDSPSHMDDLLFMDIARAVRSAPSAMNRQPWRLAKEGDGTIVLSASKGLYRLDLGIAAAHAILALGGTPAELSLAPDSLSVRMKQA